MAEKTFVRITNRDIYDKLEKLEEKLDYTNGSVKAQRTWLVMLSSSFGVSFLFILGILFKMKYGT